MAGVTFNADEVFAMALEIEINGSKFYRKAAEFASDKRVKEMLLSLADMEDRHYEAFAELRRKLSQKERAGTVWDPDNEAAVYLRTMADHRVFDLSDPTTQFTGAEPLSEVFHKAVDLEKDSVVFYLGMKDLVPEKLGKDKIDDILHEEMSHITILNRELAEAS